MGKFDLRIHGGTTQYELPHLVKYVRRFGWGTEVEQEPGTDNWFHIAIPTLKKQEDVLLLYDFTYLKAHRASGNISNVIALIDRVHIWDGATKRIFADDNVSFPYGSFKFWSLPHTLIAEGMNMSIHVTWYQQSGDNRGKITFSSAGAGFEEY
ncbi:MAG: hypothetical protein KDI79_30520 [Anaerolineae bacterium]|nr:hypothetical protein [Anaerolineae bacterium]